MLIKVVYIYKVQVCYLQQQKIHKIYIWYLHSSQITSWTWYVSRMTGLEYLIRTDSSMSQ
jgi:hypothetical protein